MLMSMTCNCSSECYCCLHNQKSVDTFIEDYERGMKRIIAYSESCEIELCTEVGGGSIFLPSDFTCGLIELSRSMHHFDLLQDENRRRHIFCSDQVMP